MLLDRGSRALRLQQLDVSGDMQRLQHAPERINPLPVAPVQKGGSGPRISGPRVPVADVDGEVFEDAQRGPIPGTGDERGEHRPRRFGYDGQIRQGAD